MRTTIENMTYSLDFLSVLNAQKDTVDMLNDIISDKKNDRINRFKKQYQAQENLLKMIVLNKFNNI